MENETRRDDRQRYLGPIEECPKHGNFSRELPRVGGSEKRDKASDAGWVKDGDHDQQRETHADLKASPNGHGKKLDQRNQH